MASFFMGQIMMTGFGFAPRYFAGCNGGTLPVSQYQALFTLLGITYGGDGVQTFGLPDLRGRTPAGGFLSKSATWQPTPYVLGTIGGAETVALTSDQNAAHTHRFTATTTTGTDPYLVDGDLLAQIDSGGSLYGGAGGALIPLGGGPTSTEGAGMPHPNMQPYEVINFNIATTGIYPSRG